MDSFSWPVPPGSSHAPVWTGKGFQVDGKALPVLPYVVGVSGWNDELTAFHERLGGADHFIDRASRAHTLRQVRRHAKGPRPVILEIGCSSGYLLELLKRDFPHAFLIGADFIRGPLEKIAAQMPDVPLLQFDLVQCPLPSDSVDVAVSINVLEHIEDDVGAIRQIYRILKPGGAAVIEVPLGSHLYDVYDKVLMHFRRYDLKALCRLFEANGFKIAHASALGSLLYPGFQHLKKRNRKYLDAPAAVQREIVEKNIRTSRNVALELVMKAERVVRSVLPLRFGIRCLVTCVKPGGPA